MCFLACRVAIFDELTRRASFEAVAALAASSAFWDILSAHIAYNILLLLAYPLPDCLATPPRRRRSPPSHIIHLRSLCLSFVVIAL